MSTANTSPGLVTEALKAFEAVLGLCKMITDPMAMALLAPKGTRPPNAAEIAKGIPCDYHVKEIPRKDGSRVDKYFIAPDGTQYRSIRTVVNSLG